jgi:hypothetical protein
MSERHACCVFELGRPPNVMKALRKQWVELHGRLREIAQTLVCYGYLRIRLANMSHPVVLCTEVYRSYTP